MLFNNGSRQQAKARNSEYSSGLWSRIRLVLIKSIFFDYTLTDKHKFDCCDLGVVSVGGDSVQEQPAEADGDPRG